MTVRWAMLTVACALVLGLSPGAASAAAPRTLVDSVPSSPNDDQVFDGLSRSFALAGDDVVVHHRAPGRRQVIVRHGPGGATKVLARFRGRRGLPARFYPLAASDRRVAWLSAESTGPTPDGGPPRRLHYEVYTVPLAGGRARRLAVNSRDQCTAPQELAVAGDTVGWIIDRCRGRHPSTVRVRDMRAGSGRARTLATHRYAESLTGAGRYLAWLERPTVPGENTRPLAIVVYDVAADRVAYRVPQVRGRTVSSLALGPDGTVVADSESNTTNFTDRYDWYSVAEPTAHRIALSGFLIQAPRVAGGRLLIERDDTHDLVVSGLDGRDKHPIAHGPLGAFDVAWDGTTAVYSEQTCIRQVLWRQDVARTTSPAGSTELGCPARVRRVAGRGRSATVRLRCPRGCQGRVWLVRRRRSLGPVQPFRTAGRRVAATARLGRHVTGGGQATLVVQTFDRAGRATTRRIAVSLG